MRKGFFLITLITAFAGCLLAYNNCTGAKSAGPGSTNNTSTLGNPMAPATNSLLASVCSTVARCHSQVIYEACLNGVLATSGIGPTVGLPQTFSGAYSTLVQDEKAGLIAGGPTLNNCNGDLGSLDCTLPSVQGAYDPTQVNPYVNVPAMTSQPSSCATAVKPTCAPSKQVFSAATAGNAYTVPSNCTSVTVKVWGAGGGGSSGNAGGAGGYAYGVIPVTAGETLTVKVGGGGGSGNLQVSGAGGINGGGAGGGVNTGAGSTTFGGGGGGGFSGVFRSAAPLLMAGGGSGASEPGIYGAGGGGLAGQSGNGFGGCGPGIGGTQTSGGAGGVAQGGGSQPGTSGSAFTGGAGGKAGSGGNSGGGGGGGYFGGGGGGGGTTSECSGGGGSGFADSSVLSQSLATGTLTPPNATDTDYVSPAGIGGDYNINNNPAGDGEIVILTP